MKVNDFVVFALNWAKGNIEEKQIQGSVVPSSRFLVKQMVKKGEIQNAQVIVEFWPGTWVFTEEIIKYLTPHIQLYIVEINPSFCDFLKQKFPQFSENIYNIDVRDFQKVLASKWISKIDLIISWLPFLSLPKEVFQSVFSSLLGKFWSENTIFKQFSYGPSSKKYFPYVGEIQTSFCLFNLPPAFVFTMKWVKKI